MSGIVSITTEIHASREYLMYRDNIGKCTTYLQLVSTVRSMIERENLQPAEFQKLKREAIRKELQIQKSPSGQTEASHVGYKSPNK